MKNILDIYSTYKIMPTLQQHQLRVAAVAKQICDSMSSTVDKNGAVIACLVHDMGNIIKFDLTYFPDSLQPEGLEYWQKVKDEFFKKYGAEEHIATKKISEEIGLSETQMNYLDTIGFSQIKKTIVSHSLEQKICCYADQRVGPYGVLSIKERLIEGRRRYKGRKDKTLISGRFEAIASALGELENQIFSLSSILPEDITNQSIKTIISQLKSQ